MSGIAFRNRYWDPVLAASHRLHGHTGHPSDSESSQAREGVGGHHYTLLLERPPHIHVIALTPPTAQHRTGSWAGVQCPVLPDHGLVPHSHATA